MNSIRGRLILMLLLIMSVLMPALLFAIDSVVERNITNTFLDQARIFARTTANSLEDLEPPADAGIVVEHLDHAILGGLCGYAAIQTSDALIVSSLMDENDGLEFREDFQVRDHDDDIYFLSLPIELLGETAVLQLGFDESPVVENLATIRATTVYLLIVYVILAVVATGFLSSNIVEPLAWLQRASRAISSGDVGKELKAETSLVEIRELAKDLEKMRSNLVGINARLQTEIAERANAEAERLSLERHLRHAQRLESLGTLAGGVAHEFNNVLQPILLFTDLTLEQLPPDSTGAENLRRVMDLAKRAKGLSNQILTFGRYDTESELNKMDLAPVVDEALTMIRALLPATVDIRSNVSGEVGQVRCDPAQIKQLLVNLCNNAYQALAGGEGHIEVLLKEVIVPAELANKHPRLREGEYAVLEVIDTGCGMDAQTMERAFEPFFTTQEVGEGTGLGLSVVHGIVMRHDGEIILESSSGKGARFRIFIPLAEFDQAEFS
jgi:signal transduction histidine kinase